MTKKYISARNLPPRIPIGSTLLLWLALDRFQAPPWAYGVMFTLMAIIAICAIVSICTDKAVDLFKSDTK